MTEAMLQPPPPPQTRRRGFVDPRKVRAFSFAVVTLCLIITVAACILAIWDFAAKDVLWRTVATCAVITGGMAAFTIINELFGPR